MFNSRTAIQQEKKRTLELRANDDIRQEYVHHLLSNVPKDTKGKFQIIEKTTVAPPSAITNENNVYDSIEGYRIEIKKEGKRPTTMVLKKKNEEELKKEQEKKRLKEEKEKEVEETLADDDPDALFETMMMLKDMNMDKQDEPSKPIIKKEEEVAKPVEEKPAETKKEVKAVETKPKEVKKVTFDVKEEAKPSNKTEKDTNVIQMTDEKPKKPAKKTKKKAVPELSLFGTIWTILDHMTTKATRVYLSELQTNHQRVDLTALLAEDNLMDDSIYLRGQILSERILET